MEFRGGKSIPLVCSLSDLTRSERAAYLDIAWRNTYSVFLCRLFGALGYESHVVAAHDVLSIPPEFEPLRKIVLRSDAAAFILGGKDDGYTVSAAINAGII